MDNQNLKLKLFKHMESQFVKELTEYGKIRISGLKSYKDTSNIEIQDSTEGLVYNLHSNSEKVQILKKDSNSSKFVEITNDSDSIIRDANFKLYRSKEVQDVYCICTSISSKKNLFKGYDACVEILNYRAFFGLIAQELKNKNLIETFKSNEKEDIAIGAPIEYVDEKVGTFKNYLKICFIKEKKNFQHEKEYRIIYKPVLNNWRDKVEHVDLVIPKLKTYCKRIW